MKKLITLCALLLCALTGTMAADYYTPTSDEVIILNDVCDASATTTGFSKHPAVSWAAAASKVGDKVTGDPYNNGEPTISSVPCFSIKGNGGAKNITLTISGCKGVILYHEKHSSRYPTLVITADGETTSTTLTGQKSVYYNSFELDAEKSYTILLKDGSNADLATYAIKLLSPLASTTPVLTAAASAAVKVKKSGDTATQEIAITGENLTGQKLEATLNPTIEGLSVDLQSDVIEGGLISTTATLTYTETKDVPKNTTTLTLSDGVTSKEITITYLAKITYSELETINEATTWDFKTAVSGGAEFSNDDSKTEYVYADIADFEDLTFTEAFNAKALSFKGQFPFRPSNKFAQNGVLHFKTLYPGEVKVTFSNTGNADDKEENYRYVKVNGVQGKKETHTTTEVTESFYVAAGDVNIEGTAAVRYYTIVFTPAKSTNITIENGLGYRTFASKYPTDWSSVTEVTAYTAKVNGNEVTFEKVTGIVPAGEGLLLKGEDDTYTVPTATTAAPAIDNALVGVTTATEVAGAGIFVLYNGDDGLGFYKTTAEKFTVGANTAYLPASVSPTRMFIPLTGGETTGVDAIETVEAENVKFFDLQGRQVSKPTKGLYISNGKKYIVK